jgi:GNAT superfamily N-acetyltransferase
MSQTRLRSGHRIDALREQDFGAAEAVINDAAEAYRGVIPDDCWHEPYMSSSELAEEIAAGVSFFGYWLNAQLVGVMGMQTVQDVTLIRHAYVLGLHQRSGIGSTLLQQIIAVARLPLLVGTWAAANWAIDFYQRHGFKLVDGVAGVELLHRYWRIIDRQAETSVVLRWVCEQNVDCGNEREDVR